MLRPPPVGAPTMPSSDDTSPAGAAEDEMTDCVLRRFISIPEQTYEDFLSSFTCVPPGSGRQQPEVMFDGSHMKKSSLNPTQRGQDKTGVTNGQEEPEQLTIGDGIMAGICHSLTHPGRVQVDNYFDSSDLDTASDSEEPGPGVLLFPGEAELDLEAENATIVRNTCLQINTSSGVERTAEEHLGDDIQPFSLDQSFDYDRVALTSKVSAEEMNFLRLREPQQMEVARET
ncbi:intraflagellar transport-associated protein [Anomaloglossus baeobatrachus]|uniref:intraflagellar transport-associated protein n=1 Tax=Anomaloglossus baeobatrachus TaxID=238106 RepID=UPI003F503AD7